MGNSTWSLLHDIGYMYFVFGVMAQSKEKERQIRIDKTREKFLEWPSEKNNNEKIFKEVMQTIGQDMEDSIDPVLKRVQSSISNIAENLPEDNVRAIIDDLLSIVNAASPQKHEIDQINSIAEQIGVQSLKKKEVKGKSGQKTADEEPWTLLHDMCYLYYIVALLPILQGSKDAKRVKLRIDAAKEKISEWPSDDVDGKQVVQKVSDIVTKALSSDGIIIGDKIKELAAKIKNYMPEDNYQSLIEDLQYIVNEWSPNKANDTTMIKGIVHMILDDGGAADEETVASSTADKVVRDSEHICEMAYVYFDVITQNQEQNEDEIQAKVSAIYTKLLEWTENIDQTKEIIDNIWSTFAHDRTEDVEAYQNKIERYVSYLKESMSEKQLAIMIGDLLEIVTSSEKAHEAEMSMIKGLAEIFGLSLEVDQHDTIAASLVTTIKSTKDCLTQDTDPPYPGQFYIPKDFDHFHYIACIFRIFTDKFGQNFLPDVSKKTSELLQEWLPEDLTAPQIFKIIQPKLDELYNYDAGMVAFFLKTATQEIMEAGIFKESNLRSIVLDLVNIAEADGEITENEAKFINRIAQYFGVEFSITATARGVRKAKREEDSQKVGDQKNNVDAEVYFDKGYQFEKDDNYEEAAKWYKKAAELGHAYAQASLGDAYSQGEGVPEDKPEAVKWYKKAAEQGLDYAQFCLGSAYSAGEGVPEDKKEAAKWYKKSAEQGFKMSQYFLGFAYYRGEGVPEDKAESIKWHREAADQGLDESQYFMGWAYENGEGVSVNNQEALKWYKLAAAQDNKDAQEAISRLSNVNHSGEDDVEVVPKGKRVTYCDWSEFEKEQGGKNEQKKKNLPIAKKIHDLMFDVFSEKNKIFEIRYGDGTFSLSIPKDEAKSGKRTFARVGLLSLADKCVYLDTLYRVTGTAIPPGSFTWKKNDDSQFVFRMKTIEDFEKVRNSIKQSVIGSYNCLAKTKIT